MPTSNLSSCPDCGHMVSSLAEACPSCARPLRRPASREGLFLRTMNLGVAVVIGVVLFIAIIPLVTSIAAYVIARFLR
jgi:hypothetical protein